MQPELTLDDYQAASGETASYPGKGRVAVGRKLTDPRARALIYLGCQLASETGEVLGKIAKVIRDGNQMFCKEDVKAIGKELGDVLWYVAQVAETFGLSLGDVSAANLAKLADRKARGVIGGSGDDR